MNLSVQFITRIIKKLKADGETNFKQNSGNYLRNTTNYKQRALLNKELQKCEKIKNDIQTKIDRKKQIEHYFNVIDRQLLFSMKKKMYEYYLHIIQYYKIGKLRPKKITTLKGVVKNRTHIFC